MKNRLVVLTCWLLVLSSLLMTLLSLTDLVASSMKPSSDGLILLRKDVMSISQHVAYWRVAASLRSFCEVSAVS